MTNLQEESGNNIINFCFEKDIYDAISMETCIGKRNTTGAPGQEAMEEVIKVYGEYLREG